MSQIIITNNTNKFDLSIAANNETPSLMLETPDKPELILSQPIGGGSISEDLSNELNAQEALLQEQTNQLAIAISRLQHKASSGVDTSETEDAFIMHTVAGDYFNERVTKVKYGTFYEDSQLTTVSFPNITTAESYAFYKCTSLTSINAPKLTSASSYAFAYTKLSNINLPLLETISTYTFAYITNTCLVNLPSLKTVSNSGFRDSKGIKSVDLAVATKIDALAFYYCNNLETLILRNPDTVCTLANTSVFTGTKIAGGTGYIYVPDTLLAQYQEATNWSNFANQIKPLSELEG